MSPSYPAELYAQLHRGNPGDTSFYRRQCLDAERILELGCGYGRILSALAQDGHRPIGIDIHPGLLALAARQLGLRSVYLIRSDMRSYRLAQSFDRILIPYSAIFCMLSREDVLRCLRTSAAHLAPSGRIIFDAYSADAFHRESAGDLDRLEGREAFEDVVSIDYLRETYDVLEKSTWEQNDQRLDVVYLHEPRSGGAAIRTTLVHRYLLSHQIEPILRDAGLRMESLCGDYEGNPLSDESDVMVVIASKP
jgi:SAM-dependent methyltransferase